MPGKWERTIVIMSGRSKREDTCLPGACKTPFGWPHPYSLVPHRTHQAAPCSSSTPPPRCLTSIVALTVCSAWEGLSSDVLMAPSFWAFRHWLISHLLSEAFLNHLILRSNSLHCLSSSAFIILHSKHFIYLILWCAWLEFKLHEGKHVSVLYLSSFPEQAGTH